MTPNASQERELPRRTYTSWTVRLIAAVIDLIPVAIGWNMWENTLITSSAMECFTTGNGGRVCTSTGPPGGQLIVGLLVALTAAYLVWNFSYRQGATGSSLGKSVMRFQVVDANTWRPVGFGASFLRQLVHLTDAAPCFIGFLFPLWSARRQTVADKLMGTVCVPRPRGRPSGTRSRRSVPLR